MSYDKDKTFDRAEQELDKAVEEEGKKRSITEYGWGDLFTEPSEAAYVIMKDRTTFPYKSYLGNEVRLSIGELEKRLKGFEDKEWGIEDIAVVIHNHLTADKFSQNDYKLHRRLKKYGFKGNFLLYSNISKKTYEDEAKEEKKEKVMTSRC